MYILRKPRTNFDVMNINIAKRWFRRAVALTESTHRIKQSLTNILACPFGHTALRLQIADARISYSN